jgi:hypothetical protein
MVSKQSPLYSRRGRRCTECGPQRAEWRLPSSRIVDCNLDLVLPLVSSVYILHVIYPVQMLQSKASQCRSHDLRRTLHLDLAFPSIAASSGGSIFYKSSRDVVGH